MENFKGLFTVKAKQACAWRILSSSSMLSSLAKEEKITRHLLEIFWEIVNGIGEILKVDGMELFEEIIRDSKKAEEVMRCWNNFKMIWHVFDSQLD